MRSSSLNLLRASRTLARNRAFAIAAVVTLGLGMGAAASIYALLRRVVLDPLPYPHAEQLVRLRNPVPSVGKNTEWDMAFAQYYHYQHAPTIEKIGVYDLDAVNLSTDAAPWRATQATVTVSTLDLLGARAEHGRLLDARDDTPGAADVVVLSYDAWRARFGADLGVVGRTIRINDQPAEIVGVMARGIELPPGRGQPIAAHTDLWMAEKLNPAGPFYNNHVHPMIARVAPGATVASAQAEVDRLVLTLPAEYPQAYGNFGVGRDKFHTVLYPLKAYVLGDMERSLWMLFGAVALVLVIACANVGSLLLARLETRKREFAVRTALGAAGADLAREAFSEGLMLALAGAGLAIILSVTSTRWLVWLAPAGVPRLDNLGIDWHVVLFTVAIAVAVAAAFAIVPVAQFSALSRISTLLDGGRSSTAGVARQRVRGALVVTQVALALVLVVGASLLLRSFSRLRQVNPGINAGGVLTLQWFLPYQRYDSMVKVWRFDDAALARIRALPGVASAGLADEMPFIDDYGCTVQGFVDPAVHDRLNAAHQSTCAGQGSASPGFFETLGVPLVAGRYFTNDDNEKPTTGAVIVTKAFAERFWPGENALGKGVNPNGYGKPPFYHVVGVVGDLHGTSLEGPPAIGIYYPVVPIFGRWWSGRGVNLVVRVSRGRPLALVAAIRRAVAQVDANIPLANAQDMETIVAQSMGRLAFTMYLLGIAGIVALALASVGLYGLISYLVAHRANEIGVRMALGAQARQVEALVVRGALRLAALGIVIGLAVAAAASQLMRTMLYGIAPWDPASYVAAVGVLALVAIVAGWIPARRAARIDPARVLRQE
jgi:putative ABC transport system permease protein